MLGVWGRDIQKVCELKEEKNFERKKAFPKRKEEEVRKLDAMRVAIRGDD